MAERLQEAISAIPKPLLYAGATIGALKLGSILLNFTNFVYKHHIRPGLNLIERYGKGTWALITGGGAGIGEEFCYQLAAMGFNIVIVGRGDNIIEVAEQVEKLGVQARYIKADLVNIKECIEIINYETRDIEISLLVNNAGIRQDPTYFHRMPLTTANEIMITDGIAPILLTRELIPRFLQRSSKSGVIFVSSAIGIYTTPFWQIYSGTKSQISAFSLALAEEYRGLIDIEVCCPGMVRTKMIAYHKGTDVATVEQCVKGSLQKLGREDITKGAVFHEWQIAFFEFLVGREGIASYTYKMFRSKLGKI